MSAKRDYYEVLGVDKSSSPDEIKSQYRKLALKFHPDRNKSPDAQEHFKEISEAYAVLSDSGKRDLYNKHGHEGVDGRYSTEDIFRGAGGNFNDVFNDLFGGQGRRGGGGFGSVFENLFGGGGGFGRSRGNDLLHECYITLEDVLHGKQVELDLKKFVDCPDCNGTGCKSGSSKSTCKDCGGYGQVRVRRNMGGMILESAQPCGKCQGNGEIFDNPCKKCQRGKVKGTKHLSFNLPSGIDNGDYVIQGEGESIPDGDNGDLIVRVRVEPHNLYRRDGVDLYCDARISMVDASLGTEINVKTLEETQKLKIESGTQPNSILKIKSQGLPSQNSNRRGDLFVHIVVEIPKKLSKQQKSLLDEFQNSD
ncbi:MAG TPA: molecular chaperone DnaJ [Candidatus Nitrosopelagicus sp.]|jgi:molecular chaperone DnaJ|nr:molecular chaperone DnaJ [Candidatus Nitrosopelagicus sp.]